MAFLRRSHSECTCTIQGSINETPVVPSGTSSFRVGWISLPLSGFVTDDSMH